MEARSLRAVLDTNVVLDWLHFQDPRVAIIRDHIAARTLIALTHRLACDELQRVLAYSNLKIDAARREAILKSYSAQTTPIDAGVSLTRDHLELPVGFPRCRDADDQFLFALAYHGKADLLITYDKRVLKTARRVARFGLSVLSPKSYAVTGS